MGALDTKQLIGIRKQLPKFEPFFLNRFFRSQVNFETEEVAFDKIKKGVKLAPFVSPMIAGRPNKQLGSTTTSLMPAYLKPHDIVKPGKLLKRVPGEEFNGSMSISDRRLLVVAETLDEQEQSITAREEWMAVQAVLTGAVTIEGEDYETQQVDFGRNVANNITLAGAAAWDTVDPDTYNPDPDIEAWADLATMVCGMLVFSSDTWGTFAGFAHVKDKLETRRGSASMMELAPQLAKVVQFKGYYGEYECWVYKGKYEDSAGVEQPFMPSGQLLLAPTFNDDVRCYGAIQDAEAIASGGLVSASRYPKNWFTKDPSVENLQTQSAPLMATLDPDAYVSVVTF